MHPLEKFQYCPVCGSNKFEINNFKSKKCSSCGFTYYANPCSATAAIILRTVSDASGNSHEEMLAVQRAKDPAKGTLDLPGGFCDMYETVEEGMRREIKEEIGLEVDEITYLFSSPNVYQYSGMGVHTLDMDFLVRLKGEIPQIHAADDATEARWIPIDEINPEEFGLTSIRNAVIRFLREYANR
jgi:ADP-ribose pyrophosphatase YjhB (NUDIX family)